MKDDLNKLILQVQDALLVAGFVKKGDTRFTRKIKADYGREELISFTARAHRSDSKAIYISCTVGLYYPVVRKTEKFFVDDHLAKYPLVAGSISHFSNEKKFMSELYKPGENESELRSYITRELELGAFRLINTFPDLNSIYQGIVEKHPYLSDYHQVYSERENLTIVSIILVLQGKEKAIQWIESSFRQDSIKESIIQKVREILV
jgi:hypothetical protein